MPRTACVALVLSCIAGAAFGFSGKEHSALSMAGLAIARDCMDDERCRTRPSGDCGPLALDHHESLALETLFGNRIRTEDHLFTYGDLVREVDYVLDPVALLSPDGEVSGPPRSPADIDQATLERLRTTRLAQASAAQVNDTHFQEKAMASWWYWHRAAVAAAAGTAGRDSQGRPPRALFGALMMNAISNHFLEDSFAPGHVTTPRTGLHDFSAMAMHDHYNRVPTAFTIKDGPALAILLDPERDVGRLGIAVERLREIRALIEGNGTIHLRGDDFLEPVLSGRPGGNPEIRRAAEAQVVFMALVVARSIVDVFQSFACADEVNSLSDYRWTPIKGRPGNLHLASAGYPFGDYVDRPERRLEYGLIFVSYILAVGYDHDLDAEREMDGAVVFRAGVTLAVPWGKLAGWAARR